MRCLIYFQESRLGINLIGSDGNNDKILSAPIMRRAFIKLVYAGEILQKFSGSSKPCVQFFPGKNRCHRELWIQRPENETVA